MPGPITWKNVDTQDLRGVSGMFMGAHQGINSGFDALNNVVNKIVATDENNWNQQKTNNTQAYLDTLGEAKTAEELQAKQALLDSMRKSAGAQIDLPAIRAATDGRVDVLNNRLKAATDFKDWQDKEADKPHYDALTGLLAQGKVEDAQKYLAQNKFANPGAAAKFVTHGIAQSNQQKLTEINLKNETEAAKSAGELKRLTDIIAARSNEHRAMRDQQGLEIGHLASINGLPVNSDGTPKLETYTDPQREKLRNVLLAAKSKHTLQDYETGDTAVANKFEADLASGKFGNFTPSLIMQNRDTIRNALSSTSSRASVGNAATARDWNEASTQATMEERAQTVPTLLNSARTASNRTAMTDYINSNYEGSERTQAHRVMNKILDEGFVVDGKKVAPSLAQIKSALGATNDRWNEAEGYSWSWNPFGGKSFADKFEENLKSIFNSNSGKLSVKEAEEYDKWHTRKRAHELFYGDKKK